MQCKATSKRTHERCKRASAAGQEICYFHGAASPQARAAAESRLATERAQQEVARQGIILETGQDPLTVLETTLAQVVALRDRLAMTVTHLADESLRYPGRNGENIRGELTAYQAALRDTVKAAEVIVRLGLESKRLVIERDKVELLLGVIKSTLNRAGLDWNDRDVSAIVIDELNKAAEIEKAQTGRAVSVHTGRGEPAPLPRAR